MPDVKFTLQKKVIARIEVTTWSDVKMEAYYLALMELHDRLRSIEGNNQ